MSGKPATDKDDPNRVDATIGANLREVRRSQGLSQQQVADLIGKSAKQYRKYESGTARITAAMILVFSDLFETVPGAFYRNLDAFDDPQDMALLMQSIATGTYASQIRDPSLRAKLLSVVQEIEAGQDRS